MQGSHPKNLCLSRFTSSSKPKSMDKNSHDRAARVFIVASINWPWTLILDFDLEAEIGTTTEYCHAILYCNGKPGIGKLPIPAVRYRPASRTDYRVPSRGRMLLTREGTRTALFPAFPWSQPSQSQPCQVRDSPWRPLEGSKDLKSLSLVLRYSYRVNW